MPSTAMPASGIDRGRRSARRGPSRATSSEDRRLHPDSGAEGLAFNALNWLRSLDANTTLSSPMFGLTSADPRIMQLALKYQFCHFWNVDLAIAPHTHTSG